MKNKSIMALAVVLGLAGAIALGILGYSLAKIIVADTKGNQARAELVAVAPKDSFEGFESFTAGDSALDAGINVYGKVIFVDNAKALKAVKEKCGKAIEEMQLQAPELGSFRKSNIYRYYDYIWQINWDDVNKDVFEQERFLSLFLKYYQNGDPQKGS